MVLCFLQHPTLYSDISSVPVIAIFTKFDDLITQVYDMDLADDENRKAADQVLEEDFRIPLFGYKNPPKASVCLECK